MDEEMRGISGTLSNPGHIFVSSISTVDIESLLLRKYSDLSQQSNILQQRTSQEIIEQIKTFEVQSEASGGGQNDEFMRAVDLIDRIKSNIEALEQERATIMLPYETVQNLVIGSLSHSGIKIGARLSFGDAANAIKSDLLSAGEKQLLSFICYNAFYRDSIIFIDEPELSLHVDWQRQLFNTLADQGTSNQFIIATHSPFIYSKYPDKELKISDDRGCSDDKTI